MAEQKKLSLAQLERGMRLMDRVNVEEGAATEMVAVYLASPAELKRAKAAPEVFEALIDQAAALPGEEAAEVISDFFVQCVSYSTRILGSLPEIPEAIRARIVKAQSGIS